jgi:hypothetical protein
MPDLQPLDAVARTLDLAIAEAEELVVAGVLPEGKSGRFDVLACVRAYAAHLRSKVVAQRITWAEARRRHEEEGANFAELGALLGVSKQRVSFRAKTEEWFDRSAAIAASQRKALRQFVERDTTAILENLALKHELNRDLLELAKRHVDKMKADAPPNMKAIFALRHLAVTVRTIEHVDAVMAGLRDDGWRARGEKSAAEGVLDPAQIRARLKAIRDAQELERKEAMQ